MTESPERPRRSCGKFKTADDAWSPRCALLLSPRAHPGTPPAATRQQSQSPAKQEPDPSLDPLDTGTIQQILATVRGLPRPALEGFTKAFRKRFQVPEEAPLIADRICQRRHHDWIETFLVQHTPSRAAAPIG